MWYATLRQVSAWRPKYHQKLTLQQAKRYSYEHLKPSQTRNHG